MNIVLLNPKLKTWSPNVYAPLGLAYIAASLENAGHNVSILDMNSHKVSDVKLANEVKSTDVVGITGMVTEYAEVIRLTKVVKESTQAKIILGGALATTHTKDMLLNTKADYIVVGEGEHTIVNLLSDAGNRDIKGVAYKKDGIIKINELVEPIEHLDTIPYPARHLLDMSRYTTHHFKSFGMKVPKVKSSTLLSSRGCPFQCSFCFHNVWGHKWRGRSPENIIGEMKQLNEDGFNGFVFNDDTFVVNKIRVMEFCRQLKESGLNVMWYCNGRVNLMDEELIKTMSEAGCVGIAYGIESGSQDILDSIKKAITIEQVKEITELTKKYGIYVTGYFMIGILGDSRETIKQTIDFARELDLNFYGFGMTSPIHGTPMYETAKSMGMVNGKLEDWSSHASINMTLDCSKGELEGFNKDAFVEFTMKRRYGKHYIFNPYLWFDGIRSVWFLLGKRPLRELIKKSWGVLVPK